jgi:glycosyltransferase involved in cell wall biosynthesis
MPGWIHPEGRELDMKKLIVIIPALNEETTIEEVLRRMPDLRKQGVELKPVVIDDGSTDHTAELAEACGATVIRHGMNLGVGKSFHDGLEYALDQNADMLVNIDADLQYSPEDISVLIQPILDNQADFVTADRFAHQGGKTLRPEDMPKLKFWGNQQMTALVNWLAGTHLGDVSSGFRAINREAILNLNLSGKYTYTHETIIDLGFKQMRLVSVPIKVKYYPERKSRVAGNLVQYTNRALRIIFKAFRDYRPFYFFGMLAALPLFLGGIALIFMLIFFIKTGDFYPYKFIGLAGIYLFSLGLILIIIGFLADILVGIRLTGEKQLYLLKKNK